MHGERAASDSAGAVITWSYGRGPRRFAPPARRLLRGARGRRLLDATRWSLCLGNDRYNDERGDKQFGSGPERMREASVPFKWIDELMDRWIDTDVYLLVAINGVLAIVLPHIRAMRPELFFISTNVQVS